MIFIEDEHFARQLQNELHAYENFKRQKENTEKENLNPVDSKLEFIDPTPSIHDLFVKFDKKFFWNTLGMVQVLWSNRMTKCAGMCSFEGGRGLCKISLSAPLLSLRPRKDLVETLLHEMIHAYLFVTHNYKDREDHGPEFHKHMFRINKQAGTKITVYHTFYDEVEYYQKHIWRCNGPCQKKKPYFGFVKRAINRQPGPYDIWWNQHQTECGGTFIKISEPEQKTKKARKTKTVNVSDKTRDIRDFFTNKISSGTVNKYQKNPKSSNIKTLADLKDNKPVCVLKTNTGAGTVVITSTNKGKVFETKSPRNPNLAKEFIKDKNEFFGLKKSTNVKVPSKDQFSANQCNDSKEIPQDPESDKVRETVRNIWSNKFPDSKSSVKSLPGKPSPKKIKLECPICDGGFSEEEIHNHVEECLKIQGNVVKDEKNFKSETSSCGVADEMKQCSVCNKNILQSEMNDHLETCISLIFKSSFENGSNNDFNDEIVCESVPCPCCFKWFKESEMNIHIDECLTLHILKEEILAS